MLRKLRFKLMGACGVMIMALLVLAFPTTAQASAAIAGFNIDRTAIGLGESATFTITTDNTVYYVWAVADGVRFQGTIADINDAGQIIWEVVASPTITTNVAIFVGADNFEEGAAAFNFTINVTAPAVAAEPVVPVVFEEPEVPVAQEPEPEQETVVFEQVAVPDPVVVPDPVPAVPVVPVAESNPSTAPAPVVQPPVSALGPVSIHSVIETPSQGPGMVQLTIVTGLHSQYVWVRYDGDRFARATRTALDSTSQTWVVNYSPPNFLPHQVQVGSNRSYVWQGASLQNFNVNLVSPFIQPLNPRIQSATVSPRDVHQGGSTTIRIRTNEDVEHVWIRDVDGFEREARRISPTTATQRNWEVTFSPSRSGSVQIYANVTRSSAGAAFRSENISVGVRRASIINATATWQGGSWASTSWWGSHDSVIRVTTCQFTNAVWVTRNDGTSASLTLVSGSGTSNRVWETRTRITGLPVTVHASSGMFGGVTDTTRSITSWTNVGGTVWSGSNVWGGSGWNQWGWAACPAGHTWPNQHCSWCTSHWWNHGWTWHPSQSAWWHGTHGWSWGGGVFSALDWHWTWSAVDNQWRYRNWRTGEWGSFNRGSPGPGGGAPSTGGGPTWPTTPTPVTLSATSSVTVGAGPGSEATINVTATGTVSNIAVSGGEAGPYTFLVSSSGNSATFVVRNPGGLNTGQTFTVTFSATGPSGTTLTASTQVVIGS